VRSLKPIRSTSSREPPIGVSSSTCSDRPADACRSALQERLVLGRLSPFVPARITRSDDVEILNSGRKHRSGTVYRSEGLARAQLTSDSLSGPGQERLTPRTSIQNRRIDATTSRGAVRSRRGGTATSKKTSRRASEVDLGRRRSVAARPGARRPASRLCSSARRAPLAAMATSLAGGEKGGKPFIPRQLAGPGSPAVVRSPEPSSPGPLRSEPSTRGSFREKIDYSNLNRPRRSATSRVSLWAIAGVVLSVRNRNRSCGRASQLADEPRVRPGAFASFTLVKPRS